ncbi:MAG: PD-(D/E)XK nuclease family protein, partial [Zoogloeaceae bacterium]|nr:PD-(D/E)XK nuclease family protein [Zoogloeaceae bacterium]
LGAKPLDKPVEGMDALERGTLLHRVMETFFAGRTQDELSALSEAQRDAAVHTAVATAFAAFDAEREEKLPVRFAAMEQGRLAQLLSQWLPLELARPVPFSVVACEKTEQTDIAGIEIDLRVDRVDQLADGRTLVIDYKTGKPDVKGWEGERLAEPQLPVYATQTAPPPVGVMFARVRVDECGFVGWAEEENLAGGVKAVDWPAATARWHEALTAIAAEIRNGVAAVRFKQEKDLEYCGVLPLLRLPEAKAQRDGQ